jgi:hypothetical protein
MRHHESVQIFHFVEALGSPLCGSSQQASSIKSATAMSLGPPYRVLVT